MKFINKNTGEIKEFSPTLINSAILSAQNRQRYYWCNWPVTQPDDKEVNLSDIIENGIACSKKAYCIDANYWKGGNIEQYFTKSRRELIFFIGRGNNIAGFRAIDGKTPSLTANYYEQNNFLADKTGYRKLTPIECERLQTVPDNYTASVSNTQRYRMLGNGWTVDVIAHIFMEMIK